MKSTKKIVFEPRSANERKQRILAVAYVTQQVGGWQSTNVSRDIVEHLRKEGYPISEEKPTRGKGQVAEEASVNITNRVTEAMVWLTEQGHAARVVKGRRTTEFVMDPSVEVPVPDYVKGREFRRALSEPPATNGAAPQTPGRLAPPLPSTAVWDLKPLNAALRAWHAKDRTAAERWVAGVIQDLENGL